MLGRVGKQLHQVRIVYWLEGLAISIWYLQVVTGNRVLLISSVNSGVCFISPSTA